MTMLEKWLQRAQVELEACGAACASCGSDDPPWQRLDECLSDLGVALKTINIIQIAYAEAIADDCSSLHTEAIIHYANKRINRRMLKAFGKLRLAL